MTKRKINYFGQDVSSKNKESYPDVCLLPPDSLTPCATLPSCLRTPHRKSGLGKPFVAALVLQRSGCSVLVAALLLQRSRDQVTFLDNHCFETETT
jgi:hypothetical protein